MFVAQGWTRQDRAQVLELCSDNSVNHSVAPASCWSNEPSRNRTYIGNLEGFCPDPLDDEPVFVCKKHWCATEGGSRGWYDVTS